MSLEGCAGEVRCGGAWKVGPVRGGVEWWWWWCVKGCGGAWWKVEEPGM